MHTPKGSTAKPTEWTALRLLLFPYEKHVAGYAFYYGGMATYGTKSHIVDNFRTSSASSKFIHLLIKWA